MISREDIYAPCRNLLTSLYRLEGDWEKLGKEFYKVEDFVEEKLFK